MSRSVITMGLLAGAIALGGFTATAACAHDDSYSPYQSYYPPNQSYYQGGYYSYQNPHVQAEREHIEGERAHIWQDQRARDEALRYGDVGTAWALQQHIQRERHHVWHERQHLEDEE